ncbi:MAG: PilN domain-containing protein [Gammaproteobacteria bacterium]|nr:PilN domain-containing protein [Gammaproteobacteria bacterium]
MRNINLLPWREELHYKQLRCLLAEVIGCAVIVILILLFWRTNYTAKIVKFTHYSQRLENNIAFLSRQKNQAELLHVHKLQLELALTNMRKLQLVRKQNLDIWLQLSRNCPAMIFLTKVELQGTHMVLSGQAQNAMSVAEWIKKLTKIPLFSQVSLNLLSNSNQLCSFTLTIKIKPEV